MYYLIYGGFSKDYFYHGPAESRTDLSSNDVDTMAFLDERGKKPTLLTLTQAEHYLRIFSLSHHLRIEKVEVAPRQLLIDFSE